MPRRLAPLLALALTAALAAACTHPRPATPPPLAPEAYAHYLRGRAAYFEADYGGALAELDRAAVAAPDQAGVAVARAEALYRLGRRVDAATAIRRAAERWPRAAEVWLAAGDVHRGVGELARAATAYRRALELDPTRAEAYLGLAATHTQARRPAAAERVYRELVAAMPEAVDGHEQLAQLLLARGADAAATPYLRRVVELDGDRLDAHRALAGVQVRAGQLADAIATTRVAFDRSGGDVALATDLVWLLLEAGDRRGALDVLALYDATSPAAVLVDVAQMYLAMGELERAHAAALAAARQGRDTTLLEARVLVALGRTDDALAVVDGVGRQRKAWASAQAIAIDALLGAGLIAPARARAAAALQAAPTHLGVVTAAAEAARQAGDVATGRAAFRVAAAAHPHDAELALAWSSFEARAGEPGRALALAEQVLAATPDAPGALNLVGFTLVELGRDLPRAHRLLARARGLAPGDPSVLDSWGWLLRAEGDLAGADRALTRAVTIAPHEPEILAHAAAVALAAADARARAARLYALARRRPAAPEVRARLDAALAALGDSPPLPPCYDVVQMKTPALVRVVLGSLLATTACQSRPSKADCDALLTHIISIEAIAAGATKGDKAEVAKQQATIKEYAIGQKFMESCTRGTPKSVVKCGLAAKTMDDLAKCDAT